MATPARDEIDPVRAAPSQHADDEKLEADQKPGSHVGAKSAMFNDEQPVATSMGLPTEAIRKLWTKWPLIGVFTGLFVMNFSMIFAAASAGVYDPYATSHFQGHSLISTANVIHGIVRVVSYPLLAKVADHIGRPQGFFGAAISMALANVLYAACHNVETYLAGGIFEAFGDVWWTITEQIFIADVTPLINRGFLFTLPESLAALPTIYAGTYLGEHMLLNSSWRWGYGMWAAIMPFCAIPTITIMVLMERRGRKQGINYRRLPLRASSGVAPGASLKTQLYNVLWLRLDILGAFLLLGGLSMTLLPISITGRRNTDKWSEPSSIALITVGLSTFVAFLVWDGMFAKNPIVPLRMIRNRNVVLACGAVSLIAISDATYRAFAGSFLQVAGGFSPGHAVRIDNARRIAVNFSGIVVGLMIRFVKHTKPFIVIGCVMIVLATGLPIYFTNIDGQRVANEASLTTGFALLGTGRGFAQVPLQVALQAAVPDHEIGVATALFLASLSLGPSIGNSISGAIWNTVLPRQLASNLPEEGMQNATAIFRSLVVAQQFEVGTPMRDAINLSYRNTQQTLAIASVSIAAPLLIIMLFARNVRLAQEDEKRAEQAEQAAGGSSEKETAGGKGVA